MKLTCDSCGYQVEAEVELHEGDLWECPSCGKEVAYQSEERKKPQLYVRRPNKASAITPSEEISQAQQSAAPTPPRKSTTVVNVNLGWLPHVAILIMIVVGAYYWHVSRTEEQWIPVARQGEDTSNRRTLEQDDEARKARLAREEAERVRRAEEERLRREKREAELAAARDKAEKEREVRDRFNRIERQFRDAPLVFASDFSVAKTPLALSNDTVLYVLDSDYIVNGAIKALKVQEGRVVSVESIAQRPVSPGDKSWTEEPLQKRRMLVKEDGGPVWICGTGRNSWLEKVTLVGDVSPMSTELKELQPVLAAVRRMPTQRLRLSLQERASGNKIPLGIYEYNQAAPREKIKNEMVRLVGERRAKALNITPPKLKKFVPTVEFYTGDIIRKEHGRTLVPRTFTHLGTKQNGYVKEETVSWAERQWRDYKEEAERQERRVAEVERENAERMRAYEAKLREISGRPITGEEIEKECGKFQLLVERSRSKLEKSE